MLNQKLVDKLDNRRVVVLINEIRRLRTELTLKNVSIKIGRKDQVLLVLKTATKPLSIKQIAQEVSEQAGKTISTKNISSQLTYLKDDGHKIFKDEDGRKVLSSRLELLK